MANTPEDQYDDEYDDRPPRRPAQATSGLVTAVGILAIVLGSLGVLCGLLVTVLAGMFTSAVAQVEGQGQGGVGAVTGIGALLTIIFLGMTAVGAGMLAGGIGTLRRATWGRILVLVTSGIYCVLNLAGTISAPSGQNIVMLLISIGLTAFFYIVLLNPQYTREFK